ncbi:MAG: hypothetical protein AAF333_17255 [Planctomycetota bacterium]
MTHRSPPVLERRLPPWSGRRAASRVAGAAVGLALLLFACNGLAETVDDELTRLRAENAALLERIAVLHEELAALRAELAAIRQDKDQLADQTRQLKAQTQQLEEETEQLQELAGVATDGHVEAEQATRIKQDTDKKAGQTVVSFGPEPLDVEGSPGEVFFSVVYGQPQGAGPEAVESVNFYFQTVRTNGIFQDRATIDFLIDGEPLRLTPADYDIQTRRTGITGKARVERSNETVTLWLDRPTLARLATARSLAVTTETVTITFDRDDRAALRALQSRLVGQVSAPAE